MRRELRDTGKVRAVRRNAANASASRSHGTKGDLCCWWVATDWLVHRADADKRILHHGLYEICLIDRSGLCILHPTGMHELFGGSS